MSIKIADLSHWNQVIDFDKVCQNVDGVILKCGGGDAGYYQDATYAERKTEFKRRNRFIGSYWFAGHNDPVAEADWFLTQAGDIAKGELLFLDAETGQTPDWCGKFIDVVIEKAGFIPLIYAPVNNKMNWLPIYQRNVGLWIANYGWFNLPTLIGRKQPKIGVWPFYALWQFTSRGRVGGINGNVDLSICNSPIEILRKYGKQ